MKDAYTSNVLNIAIPIISKSRLELLSSGTYFLATTDNGKIVGCGGWTKHCPSPNNKNHDTRQNTGHIRHFATHPDYTRQGIGKKIYDQCKNQAIKHDIQEFECFASLNAEEFYKSLGFKTIQKTSIPITEEMLFPCILMHQIL
jgi:N-acetylglutamate synthase-like GNAT family acetyltransferase